MATNLELKEAPMKESVRRQLKISLGNWALVSILYLCIIWLLYVYWVYPMETNFTKSYTVITVTIFVVIAIAFIGEALINTAQKKWWEEVPPSEEGE